MRPGLSRSRAAMYYQTPACGTSPAVLEPYSSYGGDPILFDTSGAALATPQYRNKPDLTGPDGDQQHLPGVPAGQQHAPIRRRGIRTACFRPRSRSARTTRSIRISSAPPPPRPMWPARPRCCWQANSALTPTQIATALESTALPMAEGAYGSGAGFVQMDAALGVIPVGAPALSRFRQPRLRSAVPPR